MPAVKDTRLRLATSGSTGADARLYLDDTEISASVTGITLNLQVGELNKASITYYCHQIDIDGVFHITHQCGLTDEPSQ